MIVVNATVFQGNPYHELLYSDLQDRYEYRRGTFETALELLKSGESDILHIHWEENPLRKCRSVVEADLVTQRLGAQLRDYVGLGGKVFWTLHNEAPHELEFVDQLMKLRQSIADAAERILIHNTQSAVVLNAQVAVAQHKYFLLPHPSYLGVYAEERGGEGVARPEAERALFFGLLRQYKGLDLFMRAIETPQEISAHFEAQVRGGVIRDDPYAQTVESYIGRAGVDLVVGNVPDDAVPALFGGARCVVIPYERFLTSGVALLALTFGVPVVAVDAPQMRELLPKENRPFLFEKGDASSLKDALKRLFALDEDDFAVLARANRAQAERLSPRRISRLLGRLYDDASVLSSRAALTPA